MSDLIDHELSHEDLQKVMSTIDIPACPIVVTNAIVLIDLINQYREFAAVWQQ